MSARAKFTLTAAAVVYLIATDGQAAPIPLETPHHPAQQAGCIATTTHKATQAFDTS